MIYTVCVFVIFSFLLGAATRIFALKFKCSCVESRGFRFVLACFKDISGQLHFEEHEEAKAGCAVCGGVGIGCRLSGSKHV